MSKLFHIIDQIISHISIYMIYIYQKTISPSVGLLSPVLRHKVCAHEPHCSEYAKISLKKRGFFASIEDIIDRVSRCRPSHGISYDPAVYRVIFWGSSQISIPFLEELVTNPIYEVVAVVTQSDKAVGRGMKLSPNPVHNRMNTNHPDIPVFTPSRIHPDKSVEGKQFVQDISDLNPDIYIVVSYGKIMPQTILDIPKLGPINVHGSILPYYRGASPIQAVFVNQEKYSGITTMRMNAGMDTGDIIDILTTPLDIYSTSQTLIDWICRYGPSFMTQSIVARARGQLISQPQIDSLATYCHKITKEDAQIDIHKPLADIYPLYQGYYIWPKIWFVYMDKRFVIEQIDISSQEDYDIYMQYMLIDTDGALNPSIKHISIKPEGKKSISYEQWINGYRKGHSQTNI